MRIEPQFATKKKLYFLFTLFSFFFFSLKMAGHWQANVFSLGCFLEIRPFPSRALVLVQNSSWQLTHQEFSWIAEDFGADQSIKTTKKNYIFYKKNHTENNLSNMFQIIFYSISCLFFKFIYNLNKSYIILKKRSAKIIQ